MNSFVVINLGEREFGELFTPLTVPEPEPETAEERGVREACEAGMVNTGGDS